MRSKSRTKLRDLGPNVVRFPGYIRGKTKMIAYAGQEFRDGDSFLDALPETDHSRTIAWTEARYYRVIGSGHGHGSAA
jgi:hypothetical protein